MSETFSASICIAGTRRTGLVAGACFAEMGHYVRFFDSDSRRLCLIEGDPASIQEPGLDRILSRNRKAGRVSFAADPSDAFFGSDFIFVDTLDYKPAARSIARTRKGGIPIVVALTPAASCGDRIEGVLRTTNAASGVPPVVANPLFLRRGTAVTDFLHPGRVVIGSRNIQAAECVAELYAALRCPIVITDLRTAESVRHPEDALAATLIRIG